MVKIKNVFGDEYKGKQKHMVYQKRYGRQIRRLKEEHKRNDSPQQREQQRRFRVGLSWYKGLSYEEKQGLKLFLRERGINLTAQQYAIKTALDRGKVSKEVFEEQVRTWVYKEGWDAEGWLYRQKITIVNNNDYDLTDFQVRLELDDTVVGENFSWARHGADLRFYDEAGNKLPYYVESWDEVNKQAIVWVKVGLIPGGGAINIYMYYGNSGAASESDPEQVFEFFDDFDGSELDTNKWDNSKAGDYIVSNGKITFNGGCGSGWCYIASKAKSNGEEAIFSVPFVIEAKWNPNGNYGMIGWLKQESELFYCTWAKDDGTFWYEWYDGSEHKYGSYDAQGYHNVEAIHKLEIISSSEFKHYANNTLLKHATDLDRGWVSGRIVIGEWSREEGSTFDWIRVRKYAEQEPSVSVGSEEYGLTEGEATVQVEHIIIEHAGMSRVMILDENGELIKEYENLSNISNGEIATRLDFVNRTGKTVRQVIIESISWVLNSIRL